MEETVRYRVHKETMKPATSSASQLVSTVALTTVKMRRFIGFRSRTGLLKSPRLASQLTATLLVGERARRIAGTWLLAVIAASSAGANSQPLSVLSGRPMVDVDLVRITEPIADRCAAHVVRAETVALKGPMLPEVSTPRTRK